MAEWLCLIHPPRENFVDTITPGEVAIMMSDPAIISGPMEPELRPMRVGYLRGRD